MEFPKAYDPAEVERRWYAFWEARGVFRAEDGAEDKRPTYVVHMPPPNVTGSLHIGHALQCSWQDALIRWHRMRGFNTLWQPGIDHAGIATQLVVERLLLREGKTRHEVGREEFTKRIWKWKEEKGGRIAEQQRVIGSTADWARSKFTMDSSMTNAVTEAFVQLFDQGLMYRATRLINWCPECQSALSDLEVETEEGANGELFEFAYLVEGSDERLVVATTRPETMLGDTAVAIHPDDPRYTHLHGKRLVHPFMDRTIPIVTDAILVDMKFGTGAVKVTPAHDFNDFATGKRNGLDEINILNKDGTLNENAGPFAGLDRKRARTAVKKALEEKGLAVGSKPHRLNIPRCGRSGGVVEPMISTQWFLKMDSMAKSAVDAVKTGKTEIIPADWSKTYFHFLENIQDWCVSRQLWWGHQIPAWYGPNGEVRVARSRPLECGEGWTQDPDVLDTWFSSALWPFSTLGWPDKTAALDKFYPSSDLETGYDILFFWVARMMMMGLHFMKEVPFKRVILSGIVVDETGEKMSKVKGNGVDPLDLIYGATFKEVVAKTMPDTPEAEALTRFKKAYPSTAQMGEGFPAFGADAVRMTLLTFPPSNRRIALAPKRIEGYRFFANKMWNATKYSMEHLADTKIDPDAKTPEATMLANRWILSRLDRAAKIANDGMTNVRFDETANELYRFFWTDVCDWYLELSKITFFHGTEDERKETRAVLGFVLERSLRLLHPLMPYVTEELWQRLCFPDTPLGESWATLALRAYPEGGEGDAAVEKEVDLLQKVIGAARTIRSEHDIKWVVEIPVVIRSENATALESLRRNVSWFTSLTKSKGTPVIETSGARINGAVAAIVPTDAGAVEVHIELRGLVTKDEELTRIDREKKRLEKDLAAVTKKLGSPGFVDRAPKEVIEEAHQQKASMENALTRLAEARSFADEL